MMAKRRTFSRLKLRATGWAVLASLAWILLLWWLAASLSPQAALNRLHHLRSMEPNEIGDFLAGAFSPLAFIWLVSTVWLQRNSQQAANRQFEETQANGFKLALFEKRFEVKQNVEKGRGLLLTGQESEGRKLIWDAVDAAEFLFGSALQAEIKELSAKARRIQFLDLQYDRLQKKENRTPDEDRLLSEGVEETYMLGLWLINELTEERIADMFRPYLQMPEPPTVR